VSLKRKAQSAKLKARESETVFLHIKDLLKGYPIRKFLEDSGRFPGGSWDPPPINLLLFPRNYTTVSGRFCAQGGRK